MTEDEIKSAIEDVKKLCDEYMNGYQMVSLRSALNALDIDPVPVIKYVAEHGFDYCLDSTVKCSSWNTTPEYPIQDVCYWGPDQLKSRLECLH